MENLTNATTTLMTNAGGLNATATIFSVADASAWPAIGTFRILIDSEIMTVLSRSGNLLTVTRGSEGTAATFHAFRAQVVNILTAASLDARILAVANPMTAAEDIIVGGVAGAPSALPIGAPGQIIKAASGAVGWHADNTSIGAIFDGSGTVLPAGLLLDLHIEYYCDIIGVTVLGNALGTATFTLERCSFADFDDGVTHPTYADDITGGHNVNIAAACKMTDNALTGWSKRITTQDILRFTLTANTLFSRLLIDLQVSKGVF